ncbi:MAG: hypothetical protein ONB37_19085, partial [candidate division KSB1 bacterium]|nr:hypothetical protein [candidate division KSB1 bacterium]
KRKARGRAPDARMEGLNWHLAFRFWHLAEKQKRQEAKSQKPSARCQNGGIELALGLSLLAFG